jgi:DNA-binding transcriptional ArsR family regulator
MARRKQTVTPRAWDKLSDAEQKQARRAIIATVREALQRGPHTALELRARVPVEMRGAFPVVLRNLLHAGEVASLGHSVYAAVPWMPQTREVRGDVTADLIIGVLSGERRAGANAAELAGDLLIPVIQIRAALTALEGAGLICETREPGRYRMLSRRMATEVRQGASGRIFADVRHA